jgi:hypothetical protein
MYSIPYLETKVEVLDVFEKIKLTQNKQAIGIYVKSLNSMLLLIIIIIINFL